MDVKAFLRFLHMSPRKVRLVVNAVRGLPVLEAEKVLLFLKKDAARPVLKLLRSAIANAEHNYHLLSSDLVIKTITVDGGPAIKRFSPRAFGRGAPIRKQMSHVSVILGSKQDMTKKTEQVHKKKKETKKSNVIS